ncbi:sodium:calcium antiporter [Halobacteriaceae archaeon GCM10025711]
MVLAPSLLPQLVVGGVSLIVLIRAAGVAIDRLTSVAQAYEVPDALIAMSVIAIGTSLPEIGSHVIASLGILSGSLDYVVTSATVLGGNMGSSTAQQTLLVGVFLIAYGRVDLSKTFVRSTYAPMLYAVGLTFALAWDRSFSRVDGLVLVGSYVALIYLSFNRRQRVKPLPGEGSENVPRDVAVSLAAMAAVFGSAFVTLRVVETLVDNLALGGSMIGVVTIGVASALPEFSAVMDSIRRQAPYIALGTLVGSNVVNPLVGIGLGATISTYRVPQAVVLWDLPFKLVVGVGFFLYLRYVTDRRVGRREGFYLVSLYFVYLGVRLVVFPGQ